MTLTSGNFDAQQLRAIRELKERYVADPQRTSLAQLRPEIARSWKRSVACKVDPERPTIQLVAPQLDSNIRKIAADPLKELSQSISDFDGGVALTDPNGALVWFGSNSRMMSLAENSYPLTGTMMSEEFFGTNSDGVVVEEGRSAQIWGAEHFSTALQGSFCTSVPIRDPIRGIVRGILSIMLPEDMVIGTDPRKVLLLAQSTAAEIKNLLLQQTESRERAVMDAFVRESRKRGNRMVVAFDGRTTIASEDAIWGLNRPDYGVLASYAHEAQQLGIPVKKRLFLADGSPVELSVAPVQLSQRYVGSVLTLQEVQSTPVGSRDNRGGTIPATPHDLAAISPEAGFSAVVGKSRAVKTMLHAAFAASHLGSVPIVIGEMGSGKSMISRQVAEKRSGTHRSIDARAIKSVQDIEEQLLEKYSAFIIKHAEQLDDGLLDKVLDAFEAGKLDDVIFTARRLTPSLGRISERFHTVEIRVPPLHSRREDIPLLIEHAIKASGGKHYLSARLMELFTRGDWTGNVRQLFAVLNGVIARAEGTFLDVDQLTLAEQKMFAKSRLTRLEEAELEQIREALEEAGGNRVHAAAILEIGRATLYRKIDQYSAKGFEFSF